MWEVDPPKPVKLITGILAADQPALKTGREAFITEFGPADLLSEIWAFDQTDYYTDQTGRNILRQFVSIEKLIDPGKLAEVKLKTNKIEQALAKKLSTSETVPRPVNLDPGMIEPSKLILASTKNFSHRIYIGDNIYAELTLSFVKGKWQDYPYTFPDFAQSRYHEFLSKVRSRLVEQLRELEAKN